MANKHFEAFARDSADKLASQIEAGNAPWELGGLPAEYPVDAISGKPFEGITALQLIAREKSSRFEDNRWLTPSQLAALGGNVKKEARGVPSIVWNQGLNGELKPTQIPQTYFNVEQCENFKRPLPELLPIEQRPKAQMEDMCALLGYKKTLLEGRKSAYVTGGNNLCLADLSWNPNRNYGTEQLDNTLDGIRAITEARIYDEYHALLEKRGSEKETSYFLRESLARVFMQSHIGSKLPRNQDYYTKEEVEEQNKKIAELIRNHPNILFESAADASKVVNRIMEQSEQRYIFVDFEREEVKRLTASQCREYAIKELNKLSSFGRLNPDFQDLQTALNKRGYFNPYQVLTDFLDPTVSLEDSSLCRSINHSGFAFIEEYGLAKDEKLSFEAQNLLFLTHARSSRLGKLTEEAIEQCLVEKAEVNLHPQWLKEQQKIFSERAEVPDISDALDLWETLYYDRRRDKNDIVMRASCLVVNFDTNRIEVSSIEKAVEDSLNLIESWSSKVPVLSDNLRDKLTYQFEKFIYDRKEQAQLSGSDDPYFKAFNTEKAAALCDQFLNPARSGGDARNGNIVLRDLDHKGLIICRSAKELLEASSWQGKALGAQAEAIIQKIGLDVNKAKELCEPRNVQEARQRFNDFCCAQKTFYSIETSRRQRSEEQTIKQILEGASPEKIQEVKELIKAEIEKVSRNNQKEILKMNSHEELTPVKNLTRVMEK